MRSTIDKGAVIELEDGVILIKDISLAYDYRDSMYKTVITLEIHQDTKPKEFLTSISPTELGIVLRANKLCAIPLFANPE
jgi:hypothetical protein